MTEKIRWTIYQLHALQLTMYPLIPVERWRQYRGTEVVEERNLVLLHLVEISRLNSDDFATEAVHLARDCPPEDLREEFQASAQTKR